MSITREQQLTHLDQLHLSLIGYQSFLFSFYKKNIILCVIVSYSGLQSIIAVLVFTKFQSSLSFSYLLSNTSITSSSYFSQMSLRHYLKDMIIGINSLKVDPQLPFPEWRYVYSWWSMDVQWLTYLLFSILECYHGGMFRVVTAAVKLFDLNEIIFKSKTRLIHHTPQPCIYI